MQMPLVYYQNNVAGPLALCKAMTGAGVVTSWCSALPPRYMVNRTASPSARAARRAPTNPYGSSKLMGKEMLKDLVRTDARGRFALLRDFNPVGAHHREMMGEDLNGIPDNLVPYISQVAAGKLEARLVYGNDYATPDGNCIRDYIHVMDLANGHLKALYALAGKPRLDVWNLGTGRGYIGMEIVRVFEQSSGRPVHWQVAPRRDGDLAECWSDSTKTLEDLDWEAERGLAAMMADTWRLQQANPDGDR